MLSESNKILRMLSSEVRTLADDVFVWKTKPCRVMFAFISPVLFIIIISFFFHIRTRLSSFHVWNLFFFFVVSFNHTFFFLLQCISFVGTIAYLLFFNFTEAEQKRSKANEMRTATTMWNLIQHFVYGVLSHTEYFVVYFSLRLFYLTLN